MQDRTSHIFKPKIFWLVLWVLTLAGMWMGARHADRLFNDYLKAGVPQKETVYELLPRDVTYFVQSNSFVKKWKKLKRSVLSKNLSQLTLFRDLTASWQVSDSSLHQLEEWILNYWGPQITAAYSKESQTLFLCSPIGERSKCLEWLLKMQDSSNTTDVQWELIYLDKHRCIEVESPTLPKGWKIQFFAIHGVAVLAISPKPRPLLEIFQVLDGKKPSLASTLPFQVLLKQTSALNDPTWGFLRLERTQQEQDSLGLQWILTGATGNRFLLDATLPSQTVTAASSDDPALLNLALLRQPDDVLSLVSSWSDMATAWRELLPFAPDPWTTAFSQFRFGSAFGPYAREWKNIWDRVGKQVFISFGKNELISDRFKVPFPRTVMAMPFNEQNLFIQSVEAFVLRCNQQLKANLVVRKSNCPGGAYYEIRMGSSKWRENHGLKEMPPFAFSNGLLILATNTQTMEKALSGLAANAGRLDNQRIEGVDIRMNTKEAPETIRIIMASTALFQSPTDNSFLSPAMMRLMNEAFGVLKQFGDSELQVKTIPGRVFVKFRGTSPE
ncbi:MAG: hypothetical protein PHV34_11010 [Verrucomicrobiae bacterium]|nr:hypothetical protein [Verrucomicrobiae bacterium]